jgi:pimeloyl-ACP methyl ester carboxylesterase
MRSSYVLLNDIRLHFLTWNNGSDGQPVVLLHGLASNARIWELTAPRLLKGGLLPVALDQRGHGLTDGPDGDYDFRTFAGDLAAFLEAGDIERPLLVGHSWGASVALDYAVRYWEGSRSPLGLVLVDGGMVQPDDAPGATWEAVRERLTPPRLRGTPLADFKKRLSHSQGGWKLSEQAKQVILANFEISPDETITPHLSFEHHMQIVRAMWELRTYEHFAQVRCPVLMIPARPQQAGEQVNEFLQMKERGITHARELIAGLRVEWVEGVHDIPLQNPERLANLILDFAAECGSFTEA